MGVMLVWFKLNMFKIVNKNKSSCYLCLFLSKLIYVLFEFEVKIRVYVTKLNAFIMECIYTEKIGTQHSAPYSQYCSNIFKTFFLTSNLF